MKCLFFIAFIPLSFGQLIASENLIWQWANKIKSVNPKECPVASYRQSGDSLAITCTDKSDARYSYIIPLTAHPDSSFQIDRDKYLDINNGLDSVYIRGRYLGQATKEISRKISAPKMDRNPEAFPKVPTEEHIQGSYHLLDNETALGLGQQYRVVVDYRTEGIHGSGLYTTRIMDCDRNVYYTIAFGLTYREMESRYEPPRRMIPIQAGTIQDYLRDFVCGPQIEILLDEAGVLDPASVDLKRSSEKISSGHM